MNNNALFWPTMDLVIVPDDDVLQFAASLTIPVTSTQVLD